VIRVTIIIYVPTEVLLKYLQDKWKHFIYQRAIILLKLTVTQSI